MLRALQREKTVFLPLSALRRFGRPMVIAAAMFCLMHAKLPMRASPLAVAWMAAALVAGESPGALVAGCLLGMFRIPLSKIVLLPVVCCVLVLAQTLLQTLLPLRLHRDTESRAALTAGLAVLLPAMVAARGEMPASLQALACAALAAAAAPFFLELFRSDLRRGISISAETGMALLLGGIIAALRSFCIPAAEIFCALWVLLLPRMNTGLIAGLALVAGGAPLAQVASLCLCTWASGSDLFNRKWQRALAACIAAGIGQLLAGVDAFGVQWMLCAAGIWLLLPARLMQTLEKQFLSQHEPHFHPAEIAREATREVRQRLSALSDAFSTMAETCVAAVDVPDEQALICEMRARLCAGCAAYGDCWAGEDNRAVRLLCDLIGEALRRVDALPGERILFSDGEIPPDVLRVCRRGRMIPDRLGLLLRDFAEKRRSEIKRCADGQLVSIQFLQAREILKALARFEAEAPGRAQLQAALSHAGLSDCEAVPNAPDAASITLLRSEKRWTRGEVQRAAQALGRTLGGKYLPCADQASLRFVRAPRLSVEHGSSCQSGIAGEVSGDNHMVRMLGRDKLLIAISDGMGSGETAARESGEALRLLWSFLNAGISRALALETVNRQLLIRSSEDMFATIDLCVIDLNTGVAEFTKLAASPTLILRGREMTRVDGGRLPLGILENVQSSVRRFRLRPGDLLIMGSDGVMEAGDGLDMERYARENAAVQPGQLAENMVRHAALQRSGARMDDLTCICVRIGNRSASAGANFA